MGLLRGLHHPCLIWVRINVKQKRENYTNTYIEELYELEHVHTATKRLCVILDAKYEKSDLHKVMKTQFEHTTITQCIESLKLIQKFEELFDGTLGTWKTDPLVFELKEDANPIFLQPYPVPKVHEEMFKKDIERLVIIGVLGVENDSEWVSLSFAQPKPTSNRVCFLSGFRNIN